LLPEELRKVDAGLRSIGLSSLADEGLKVLNRAAEDAVKEATPIFVSAVKKYNLHGCKTILLEINNSAYNLFTKQYYYRLCMPNPVIKFI
jgi:hypothetical protein